MGAFWTALNSEPKLAAIGRAIGALESLGHQATAIVMGPTDYWELVTETLGSNDEGGFAVLPGGTATAPQQALFGIPVYRDLHWPASAAGSAIVGNFAPVEVYVDGEMRIDVSSEAGNRFDQNVTGFRAEEMLGFTADPWYLTGHFQRVTGLYSRAGADANVTSAPMPVGCRRPAGRRGNAHARHVRCSQRPDPPGRGMPVEQFSPAQILLGALVGFAPGAVLFFLDGRRQKANRIRQSQIAALDDAIGRMDKLLDHAASIVATLEAGQPVSGVLPHHPLAYYTADDSLIPDRDSVREFVTLVGEVMAGKHTGPAATKAVERLMSLFNALSASAARRRQELVREGWM